MIKQFLPIDNVLFLHDNTRPNSSIRTRETIHSFKLTTISYLPYSPDLVPSVYHLFGPIKDGLKGKNYASSEEEKTAVMKCLKQQSTKFYEAGIHTLIRKWNIAIGRNVDYVEKKGCDPQRTSFILMYHIYSYVGNYSCTEEKGITFGLTIFHKVFRKGCNYILKTLYSNYFNLVLNAKN